jgi:toxin ParE1/3/4
MPKVLSTSRANRDLVGIGRRIAQDSPRAADKILTAIDRKCKMLARLPRLGRRRDELSHGLRSFTVGSYVVFYRSIHGGVEIIRVLHGARDITSHLE